MLRKSQGFLEILGSFYVSKAMPGVVAYLDHRDIPGKNDALLNDPSSYEQIFSTGRIFYAGQAIGLILAESADAALQAAQLVRITYKNRQRPILSIKEALELAPEKVKMYDSKHSSGNIEGMRES